MMMPKYIEDDIVKYNDKIMVIKEPRDGSHFDLFCPQKRSVYCLVDVEEIKPIPITVEILEKNGWEKDEEASFKTQLYYRKKVGVRTIYVIIKEETSRVIYNSTCLRIIQYYHELQHLLFGLGLNSEMEV